MKSFFEDYPDFFETGDGPRRLGARHEVIIERQPQIIAGKCILDLGSHDGRWAFAALRAGASKVICVEARPDLAGSSDRKLRKHGIEPSQYDIHVGNGLDVMRDEDFKCDTVFLLGIYYHIHNHLDWVEAIRKTGADHVIIDTALTPCQGEFDNVMRFRIEDASLVMSSPYTTLDGRGFAAAGHPSRSFVNFSFRVFGYVVKEIAWKPYVDKWGVKALEDYDQDNRSTFVAQRKK